MKLTTGGITTYYAVLVLICSCSGQPINNSGVEKTENELKPRLLITTDIGGDPDDTQSLIRLLVTSSEFDLEGIIASASGTPGELDTFVVRSDLILQSVEGYRAVYENLKLHQPDFPKPSDLTSLVKEGNVHRGLDFIGENMNTEGSEWIESRLMMQDERSLNICIWGGQTDVYQALYSIKHKLSPEKLKTVIENVRIYDINDQDKIYPWIKENFPDLFYVLAKSGPGEDKREGAYRGMYLGGDESLTSREWVTDNVKENHGPLGELYPLDTWTAPNPYGCLKEGDTPSWFYFLNNGLQVPGKPSYGGWGGRFQNSENNRFKDEKDLVDSVHSSRATVWRWRSDYQNDFTARMDWCVKPYNQANHHPVAVVDGDRSSRVLTIQARFENDIRLDADGSSDPDGNHLIYKWWIYPEPSGIKETPEIHDHSSKQIELKPDSSWLGKDIHVILEVRDNGLPPLTSYRRIIINTLD